MAVEDVLAGGGPTAEQRMAVLEDTVTLLKQELEEASNTLALWRANGLSSLDSGHGLFRFGSNAGRLDNTGIQIKAPSFDRKAIWFVDDYFPTLSAAPDYYAALRGNSAPNSAAATLFAFRGGQQEADVSAWATSTESQVSFYLDTGGPNTSAYFYRGVVSGLAFVDLNEFDALALPTQTVDPTSFPSNGLSIWGRSDLNKIRARLGGVAENLATESYVDAAAIPVTLLDAKGDLIAATAADTVARLAVGTDGQVLTADAASTAGLKWATAATGGGAMTPVFIDTYSVYSIGTQLAAVSTGAPGSGAWPDANRAIFIPFVLPADGTVVKLWCANGATASGNVDMGIYDESGTRKVSIGSTAQVGTSRIQEFDIGDTALTAGRYYLAIAKNTTTGTVFRSSSPGGATLLNAGLGILEQTTAFPLPATATFITSAMGYIPWCGLSLRTLVA